MIQAVQFCTLSHWRARGSRAILLVSIQGCRILDDIALMLNDVSDDNTLVGSELGDVIEMYKNVRGEHARDTLATLLVSKIEAKKKGKRQNAPSLNFLMCVTTI